MAAVEGNEKRLRQNVVGPIRPHSPGGITVDACRVEVVNLSERLWPL